jgi:hypothetical protein
VEVGFCQWYAFQVGSQPTQAQTASRISSEATRSVPVGQTSSQRLSELLVRSPLHYALISVILLAPCHWQARLQAGDLSSHIYNSWLTQLIQAGQVHGLALVSQSTNILFDLLLSATFRVAGPDAAQRISVSLAVLVFIWGAFALACTVSGRKPWNILPCIVMLAYGWVFHMGFFNFYLGLGLAFWALTLLWFPTPRRIAAAVPVLLLAYAAHALPVVWAGGLAAYVFVAARISEKWRLFAVAGTIAIMLLLRVAVASVMQTHWSLSQFTFITGLDQTWVFDDQYFVVLGGLFLVWGSMFFNLVRGNARGVIFGIPFQVCILSAAGVVIIPGGVLPAGYNSALVFLAERMSLCVAVCMCAMLALAPSRKLEQYTLITVSLGFFGFLYRDEKVLNALEDRIQLAVAGIPKGQRVTIGVEDSSLRVNPLTHMIDRVCIGRCYSYANYEPSTAQFRVRALQQNPYVAFNYMDVSLLEAGRYVVREQDLPLYQVDLDYSGAFTVTTQRPGFRNGFTELKSLR